MFGTVTAASAALVADQRGFLPGTGVGGGFTGTIPQSFQPATDNLAGVDVFLFSVAASLPGGGLDTTADVSLAVFTATGPEDTAYATGSPIVTDNFALDTLGTREGWAEFRFAPVLVTPDTYYVLEFTTSSGAFGTAAGDPYPRGQAIEAGLGRDGFDIHFITYTDDEFVPVPLPGAMVLLAPLLGLLGWTARARR